MTSSKPGSPANLLAAVLIVCTAFTSAHAVDSCKVKVDKKTGVILVDAGGVSGPLLWGSSAGQETNSLFNSGTCVAAGKAKKCQLADPLTLASKTPPAGCTLYLDDSGAPCSAWIPGCTPSPRSGTGALVKDSTGAVLGYSAASDGSTVVREDSGVTLRFFVNPDGAGFGYGGSVYYASNDCSGPALLPPDANMVKTVVALTDSVGLYGPDTGTLQGLQSVDYLIGFLNDQAGCDSYFGPGTTFTAPHGCCFPTVSSGTLGTALSFNLGQFTAPFSVDLQ